MKKPQRLVLSLLVQLLVLSAVCRIFLTNPVLAFKPNDAGHLGITSEALNATQRTVAGETLKFSDRAIKQIRDANKDTDCLSCQGHAEFHFDDEAFSTATARLTSLKASVVSKITASNPDGAAARKDLGGALHTLQDFYAHSNHVELGNTGIDSRLGRSTFSGPAASVATCPSNPGTLGGAGLTTLTSGYFKIPLCVPPSGKCRHGIPIACSAGLNKDEPSRTGYTAARALAVSASKDFLNQILDDPSVAGNAKAIKALMDIRSTLAMVIDTTGSMGGIISQVKAQVAQIVNSVRGTDQEPSQYLLQPFNDPDVPGAFVTQDADAFIAAVNGLFASGGGDCPELSQTGILRAVAASQSAAKVFTFTDASSKDASLAGDVIAAARSKQIQITPLLFGSCSPIDPAYIAEAQETGGQLFFLSRDQAGLAFSLIQPQLRGNLVPVLSTAGTLTSGSATVPVPVDSTVESITFSVSIDVKGAISVLRPSGIAVAPGDPGVTITELSGGRVVTIATPQTGQWQLQIGGSGIYSAQIQANSSLQFNSFDFVELTGRPFHEGLFPIPGQPVTGSDQTGLASLLGPFSTAAFNLVDLSGSAIQPVSLAQGNPDAAADEFVGVFRPPATSFRVSVTGTDKNGLPYQRLFPASFRAQPLKVIPDSTVQSLPSGATTRLTFAVQNLGADSTFQIIAADDHNFITNVQPTLVTLTSGSTAPITIDVTVPAGVPDGTNIFITTSAASTTDPTISNSAVLSLPVGTSNRPPDCSAAQGLSVSLWPPDHNMVAIDILAATNITDPDGDSVSIAIDSITQDEPVFGPGDDGPDGAGIGTGVAIIRAERDGDANGRVYKINYTASAGKGGSCQGTLTVTVPHSQNGSPAIDDGQNFDSTQTPTSSVRRKPSKGRVARSLHAKARRPGNTVNGAGS